MTLRDRLWRGGRRGQLAALAAAVLAIGGVIAIGVSVAAQQGPPQPTAGPAAASQPAAHPSAAGPAVPSVSPLPASPPVSIAIPAIGVNSPLITVGKTADGSLQVPAGADYDKAAWFRASPTPGQLGPAVIEGHVDSAANGPSVFYRLGALTPGATVSVARADGTTAVFRVDAVRRFPKDKFPTIDVYANTPDAALRLITCGGSFDAATGHYRDNVIAFATLVGTRP